MSHSEVYLKPPSRVTFQKTRNSFRLYSLPVNILKFQRTKTSNLRRFARIFLDGFRGYEPTNGNLSGLFEFTREEMAFLGNGYPEFFISDNFGDSTIAIEDTEHAPWHGKKVIVTLDRNYKATLLVMMFIPVYCL